MTGAGGQLTQHMRMRSAAALVIATIIGTGIFTSTGFQAADLPHPGMIFALWIVGGVLAFTGALCYAELSAAMPEAGGEYIYLRETYGGAVAFTNAFVSLVAGFSAPIAASAKAFVRYSAHFVPALGESHKLFGVLEVESLIAIALIWALIAVHLRRVRGGVRFNDLITLFKIGGIVAIILMAAVIGQGTLSNLTHVAPAYHEIATGDKISRLATALIFVMYGYSGWNTACYVASEIKDPQRNVPRALLLGTGVVLVLYLALNAVYLYGAPVEELAGHVEVGLVAARGLFGSWGVSFVSLVIMLSIFSAISAMTIAGPRVYYALGRDYPFFKSLARVNPFTGAPVFALVIQGLVSTIIVLSGRIDQIQQYVGFTLTLYTSLAVACVIILRLRRPQMERPFRAWGYPVTPILFLSVSVWMMIWAFRGRPVESSLALLTVVVGGAIFYMTAGRQSANSR